MSFLNVPGNVDIGDLITFDVYATDYEHVVPVNDTMVCIYMLDILFQSNFLFLSPGNSNIWVPNLGAARRTGAAHIFKCPSYLYCLIFI